MRDRPSPAKPTAIPGASASERCLQVRDRVSSDPSACDARTQVPQKRLHRPRMQALLKRTPEMRPDHYRDVFKRLKLQDVAA
jgi:hypothetical protein